MLVDRNPSLESFTRIVKPYSGLSNEGLQYLYRYLIEDERSWDLDPVVIRTVFHEYETDDPDLEAYELRIIHTLSTGNVLVEFLDV